MDSTLWHYFIFLPELSLGVSLHLVSILLLTEVFKMQEREVQEFQQQNTCSCIKNDKREWKIETIQYKFPELNAWVSKLKSLIQSPKQRVKKAHIKTHYDKILKHWGQRGDLTSLEEGKQNQVSCKTTGFQMVLKEKAPTPSKFHLSQNQLRQNKGIFRYSISMKVSCTSFLWKLLEQMFYQNQRVNQEKTT